MKRLTETQQINLRIAIAVVFIIGLCILFNSCSVAKPTEQRPDFEIEWDGATIVAPDEDLLTPNFNDYKVLSYDYPYVEVLLPDSTIKYLYYPTTEIKGKGYLIADR